ncbi:unnamed protein product [Absidia cylindrospora]
MFQQRSTAPLSPQVDHYRFTTALFNNTASTNEQIRIQASLSRRFKLILRYLTREAIQQLQLTCRAMDSLVRDHVWHRPSFHKILRTMHWSNSSGSSHTCLTCAKSLDKPSVNSH